MHRQQSILACSARFWFGALVLGSHAAAALYYHKKHPSLIEESADRSQGLQVRIKLKHMEIEIRRREQTGAGTAARNESETLANYEIMHGAPVRGENIPIRQGRLPHPSQATLFPLDCPAWSCYGCRMGSLLAHLRVLP